MFDYISNFITTKLIQKGYLNQENYDSFDIKFRGYMQGILTSLILLILGLSFNVIIPVIIISIIINVIVNIIELKHQKTLELCTIVSSILVILFSLLSVQIIQYNLELELFYISTFCAIWIIKIIYKDLEEIEDKNKDERYFRKLYINSFLFLYILNLICIYFNTDLSKLISSSISFGILLFCLTVRKYKS